MTEAAEIIDGQNLTNGIGNLSTEEKREKQSTGEGQQEASGNHHGTCVICFNKIVLQEAALVKGCEHAYCVTCILRWATYRDKPTCPQCKHPFEFLNVHRSLDGSLHDYMFEESVCLLRRASWFSPLIVEEREEVEEEGYEHYYPYEDEDDDLDEVYLSRSSSVRLGNRRWGDNGYVRGGRLEARPVSQTNAHDISGSAGPSRERKKKETVVNDATVGRRAKRAMKREAADKAAAAKHEHHLVRLARK